MNTHTLLRALALVMPFTLTPIAWCGDAEGVLRAMSDKLAQSKRFTFEATREVDAALREGTAVPEKARVSVAVSRSNQIAARSESQEGTRRLIADGRRLTVVDEKNKTYAQIPMAVSIDQLVDKLDTVYGFTPPLAEFALSDVRADLKKQARTMKCLGTGKVGGFLGLGGEECHRVALTGRSADAVLWVSTSDQLPRRLVATFRQPGNPQLRVNFSAWNLNAPLTPADFAFTAPKGAQKVELWSVERMKGAAKPKS